MAKRSKNIIKPLLLIAVGVLLIIIMVKHFHIKHFRVVVPGQLYVSGQPRGMDYYRLLYKYHIAAIVNVRVPYEHRTHNWYNEEKVWVKNNGIRYIELPIQTNADDIAIPTKQQTDMLLKILSSEENLPVLVHGGSGEERVPLIAAMWLIKGHDCSVEDAVKTAEKIKGEKLSQQEIDFLTSL